jgi:hypothetical protein
LRYWIAPDKLAAFELYARVWMRLIEKFGGTHRGYFVPGDGPLSAAFSFPGLGEEGPECVEMRKLHERTKCFTKYERTFMKPVPR